MIGPVVENEIFPRFHLVDNFEYMTRTYRTETGCDNLKSELKRLQLSQ